MPEISRFFGIIVRMFVEPATRHHRPHFHAYYQEGVVVVAIDTIEVLAVGLPRVNKGSSTRGPKFIGRNYWKTGCNCNRVRRHSQSNP